MFQRNRDFEYNSSHIEVKDNVKPVVTPVHKIPHVLKPKKELDQIIDLDIIEPIKKPTDWVNGLLIVEKPNGKFHMPQPSTLE